MGTKRRVVVEVNEDLHREIRKLALLNDLKIYELTNALLEDCLRDEDRINEVLRKLTH
ncbi:MAG: hypothetical protein ACE14S_00610 [Candidatus Bathyarchaeia archaeon]